MSNYIDSIRSKKKDPSKSKMNGIHKYLSSKGLHETKHTRCVNKYIQQDFGKFIQWYSQLIRLNKHLDF